MNIIKCLYVFFILFLLSVKTVPVFAQAPNISYLTPQTYFVNSTISPLSPTNNGGTVPPNIYGQVTTVAGNINQGNTNGTGAAASFAGPAGLIFDNKGNLYVSELINNDIREISPAGVVTTLAGNGMATNTNGPGNKASFNLPNQLAIDADQNLYVADEQNDQIRKITPAGIVSVFAGLGSPGTDNGPIATCTFNNPVGVVIDNAGNMYVADRANNAIRKIGLNGQVTTFTILDAGAASVTPDAGIAYLAADVAGNLYFGNSNQIDISTPAASVSTIAGNINPGYANGSGTMAQFFGAAGIAVDAIGNIYIGDTFNNRIRKVSSSGAVTVLAGESGRGFDDGVGSSASFYMPYGVTIDPTANYLYVADMNNNLIRKVTITGYSIDKSLPNGLIFDATTGTISGTPSITSPPEPYTITAYNTKGSSTTTVIIQILAATVSFPLIPQKTVCDVDFNPGATGSGPVTYTSSNPSVATIIAGMVHITGAGTSVITASDGMSTAQQTLTVSPAITPVVTISPAVPEGCVGSSVTFTATTNVSSTASYQWQINGYSAGTNSPQFTAGDLNQGDNISCLITTTAACVTSITAASNTATFTADPLTSTSVQITSSETGPICYGTAVTFTATAFSPNVHPGYQWQVNGVNAGTNQPTFTSTTLTDMSVVTCILTSTGTCIIDSNATSNAITITLNPQSQCVVDIPNAFTPNGDGINDKWDISALVSFPGCTISIFNRYGLLVYNTINYPIPWDGTFNGKQLPTGVYYYVIDLKNGKKPLAGSVTILR